MSFASSVILVMDIFGRKENVGDNGTTVVSDIIRWTASSDRLQHLYARLTVCLLARFLVGSSARLILRTSVRQLVPCPLVFSSGILLVPTCVHMAQIKANTKNSIKFHFEFILVGRGHDSAPSVELLKQNSVRFDFLLGA